MNRPTTSIGGAGTTPGSTARGSCRAWRWCTSGTANQVTVQPGWAVDALGREIVLAAPRTNVPTGGVGVDDLDILPGP